MAKTIKYSDVLNITGQKFSKIVEDKFAATLCNLATNAIWYAFDWRESLTELPPFYLIPDLQDYGTPFSIVPADFHGLRKATLARYTGGAVARVGLYVVKDLSKTHIRNVPSAIAYEASIPGFRLFPMTPENIGSPTWLIEGTYKKRPVKITTATLDTVLPFDDMYLNVWLEVFTWAAFMLMGNTNAANEQLATADHFVTLMATQEGINDGSPRIVPESPLVPGTLGSSVNFPSLFGIYG